MLLYSVQYSPRLSYITAFIGQELLGQDLAITADKDEFANWQGPKINYGAETICKDEFRITPVEFLFEKGIKSRRLTCFNNKNYIAFFQTVSGDFPFDIFACSFYLLSRYEEYLEHTKDHYGRYAHTNSLAHQEKFLHLPLINIWLEDLKKGLLEKFPGITFNRRHFSFLPTYDIDIAYSYLNKGLWRNTGGFVRSFINGDWNNLFERFMVLWNKRADPFDSFSWLDELHSRYDVRAIYFFLMAAKQKGFDKNIAPSTPALQRLIRLHADRYHTGIHPSWQTGDNRDLLESEIRVLEKITGKKIEDSRHHYLRFTIPETYRNLIDAGIKKDYSMGYGTINGFRASVASSFYWYDLEKERATTLRIYPFCFMDANSYYQQKSTSSQALNELVSYHTSVKAVNGLMITIWHNHLLGTGTAFKGWRDAYEKFLNQYLQD